MARTNIEDVKKVINTDLENEAIFVFMGAANRFITDVLATSGLSAIQLQDIEMYLTAHLVAVRDKDEGRVQQQRIGDRSAEIAYSGTFRDYLHSTSYGQTAALLDTTGKLMAYGKPRALFKAFADPN